MDRSLYVMELIRSVAISSFIGEEGAFCCGNAPFSGGENPDSGSNYLSLLIHVGLQATCSMVTCSGLPSIVLKMITQNPVFHFTFRVQLG